jgi:LuxR family maltose regulon positive regulatory protein
MAALLHEAARQGINAAYATYLLPAFAPEHPGDAANSTLIEPLTDRELEILSLIARGRSNRQIADSLFLSVGTVKGHINHILGKLDAQNRTEAVAHGRVLGLLEQ